MDGKELAMRTATEAGTQLRKCFEGLSGSDWQARATPASLSPVETLAHLSECYVACQESNQGRKHAWGSYRPASTEPEGLLAECWAGRASAVASASQGDEASLMNLVEYVILHDAYHVGQMCALRISLDPNWDPYSIYASE